jgi:hypothetical protein
MGIVFAGHTGNCMRSESFYSVVGFLFVFSRDLLIKNKENPMRKYILVLLLAIFIIPSIANASWWNPFSWFRKQTIQSPVVQVSVPTPTPAVSTSDKQIEKEKVIPKKEKQNTQPTPKKIISNTSTSPVVSKIGGGSSGVITTGPCPIVGPCTATSVVANNNSNSNQTLPLNADCDSGTGFSSITGMSCGSTAISTTTANIPVVSNTPHIVDQPTLKTPTPPNPPQPQKYLMQDKPIIESFCDDKGNCVHSSVAESWASSSPSPYPTVHVGETLNFTIKTTGEETSGVLAFILPQGYDWVKEGGMKPWSTDLTYTKTFTTEDISARYFMYAYIKSSNDNYHRRSSGCNWTAYSCDDNAQIIYTVLP